MKKKSAPSRYLTAEISARRFDGRAVSLELVLQPKDAARLADMILHALLNEDERA